MTKKKNARRPPLGVRVPGELVDAILAREDADARANAEGCRAAYEETIACPFCGETLRISTDVAPVPWASHARPLCDTFVELELEPFVAKVRGRKAPPKVKRARLPDRALVGGGLMVMTVAAMGRPRD